MKINEQNGGHVLEEVTYKPTSDTTKGQELTPDKQKIKDTAFLYFSAITAILIMFSLGNSIAWTSPVIPKLCSNDTDINPLGKPITTSQIALLAGMPSLIALVTCSFLGKLPNILGRKRTMQYFSVVMILSNITLAFGTHIYVYYIGKIMFTICIGIASIAVQVYLSEIAEDHNRAKLGCLMGVAFPSGNLYTFILGPFTTIRDFNLLLCLPLMASLTFFLFVPESPVYLASKGNKEESIKALKQLRSNKSLEEIKNDYKKIEVTLQAKAKASKAGYSKLFKTGTLRKALAVVLLPNMTQHLSGVVAIMSFLGPLFNEAGTQLSGNSVAILVGMMKMCVFIVTSFVVEKLGRRPLLLFSSTFTGIPLFLVGLYFYWKNTNAAFIDDIRLLPIVCILVYVVFYSLGLGPIPMAIIGEFFPPDVMSIAATFVSTVTGFLVAVLLFVYPLAAEYFGVHWCLWIFSSFCFSGSFFIYFFLPETKGKSLLEIQEILSK